MKSFRAPWGEEMTSDDGRIMLTPKYWATLQGLPM